MYPNNTQRVESRVETLVYPQPSLRDCQYRTERLQGYFKPWETVGGDFGTVDGCRSLGDQPGNRHCHCQAVIALALMTMRPLPLPRPLMTPFLLWLQRALATLLKPGAAS